MLDIIAGNFLKNAAKKVFSVFDNKKEEATPGNPVVDVVKGTVDDTIAPIKNIAKYLTGYEEQGDKSAAKNSDDELIKKAAAEGKLSSYDLIQAGMQDVAKENTAVRGEQTLENINRLGSSVKNWNSPFSQVPQKFGVAAQSIGLGLSRLGEGYSSVTRKLKDAVGWDDTDAKRNELLKPLREQQAKEDSLQANRDKATVEREKDEIGRDYNRKLALESDANFTNKIMTLQSDVANVNVKKSLEKDPDIIEYQQIISRLGANQQKVRGYELQNSALMNMDLDTAGMQNAFQEKVIAPVFLDKDGNYKGSGDMVTEAANAATMKAMNAYLSEHTKIADAAINAGLYNDRQSYFHENNVYSTVAGFAMQYRDNILNSEKGRAAVAPKPGMTGYDPDGLKKFNDEDEKQNKTFDMYTDGLKVMEDKIYETNARIGISGGESSALKRMGGWMNQVLRNADEFDRGMEGKNSLIGHDLYSSFKRKAAGTESAAADMWDVVASNPFSALYYGVSFYAQFGNVAKLGSLSPSMFARTTSMGLNKVASALGRTAGATAEQALLGLLIDVPLSQTSEDWKTNMAFNLFGGLRFGKFAGNLDFFAKTISNYKPEDRIAAFNKITERNVPSTINLGGSYSEIKDSLTAYTKAVQGFNEKNIAGSAFLQSYNDFMQSLKYENIDQISAVAGTMRGDRAITSAVGGDLKSIGEEIAAGKKAIESAQKTLSPEEIVAQKDALVSSVKAKMSGVIDSLSPKAIKHLGYQAFGATLNKGAFNTLVDSTVGYIKSAGGNPNSDLIASAYMTSLLDSNGKGTKFVDILKKVAAKSGDKAMYKAIVSKSDELAAGVDNLRDMGKALEANPEKFVMSVVSESQKIESGSQSQKFVENINATASTKKAKTTRSVSGIVKGSSSKNMKAAAERLYSSAKEAATSILASDGWKEVSDAGSYQKRSYIGSYLKSNYDLPSDVSAIAENMIYSISNGIENEKDYVDALGKMVGDRDVMVSVDDAVKKMDAISNMLGGSVDEAKSIMEQDVLDIASLVSSSIKKYSAANSTNVPGFVSDGLDMLIDFAQNNSVAFRRSNLPAHIDALSSVIENDAGKKIIVSISGHIIDRIQKFNTVTKKTPAIMKQFSSDMAVFFHELGHVAAESIDTKLKNKVLGGISDLIRDGGFLDSEEIVTSLGRDIYESRIDVYRSLMSEKKYDDLAHEIFADKFRHDLHTAIFDPDNYEPAIMNSLANIGVVPTAKNRKTDKISAFLEPVISQLKDFFNELINLPFMRVSKESFNSTLSAINFAIVKGDVDGLMNKGVKFVESAKDKEKTFFKRSLSELEQNVADYVGLTPEAAEYVKIGKSDFVRMARIISEGKGSTKINGSLLTSNGKLIMADIFNISSMDAKQLEIYNNIIVKSQEASDKAISLATSSIFNRMYNSAASTLKTTMGGTSLVDVLRSIPVRISESKNAFASGGIRTDHLMSMIKYMISSDYNKSMDIVKGFLNTHFSKQSIQASVDMKNAFLKNMGNIEGEGVGDAVVRLYGDLRKKLTDHITANELDISMDEVDDIISPVLFNPAEYVYGVSALDPTLFSNGITIADSVLAKILQRRKSSLKKSIDGLEELTKLSNSDSYFAGIERGSEIRNYLTTDASNSFAEYIKANSIDIPMTEENMYEYMYKIAGYFTAGGDWQVKNMINLFKDEAFSMGDKGREILDLLSSGKYDELGSNFSKDLFDSFSNEMRGILSKLDVRNSEIDDALEAFEEYAVAKEAGEPYSGIAEYFVKKILKGEDVVRMEEKIANGKKSLEDISEEIEKSARVMSDYYGAQTSEKNAIRIIEGSITKSKADPNTKKTAAVLGINEEVASKFKEISGFSVSDIAEGRIPNEVIVHKIMEEGLAGRMSFTDMMLADPKLLDVIKGAMDKAMSEIKNTEKIVLGADGQLRLEFDPNRDAFWRILMKTNTFSNIGLNDPETQQSMQIMHNARETAFIYGPKAAIPLKDGAKSISGQLYVSIARDEMKRLAQKAAKGNSITGYAGESRKRINNIYKDTIENGYTGFLGSEKLSEAESKLSKFVADYIEDIESMRSSVRLGSAKKAGGKGFVDSVSKYVASADEAGIEQMANRLTGLWVYARENDISRIHAKYGDIRNFVLDVLFKGNSDKGFRFFGSKHDNKRREFLLGNTGSVMQGIGSGLLYNVLSSPYKFSQQVVSNTIGAAAQMSLGAYSKDEFDVLFKMINSQIGFDVIRTAGKNDEMGLIGKAAMSSDKIKSLVGTSTSLFVNFLPVGDEITKKRAILGAMTKALLDEYSMYGKSGIDSFLKNVENMNTRRATVGIKDSDLFSDSRVFKRVDSYVKNATRGMSKADAVRFQTRAIEEYKARTKFYKDKYSRFVNETRSHVSAFFVTDNISEFANINAVSNSRVVFGLMKWATGKTFQYALDIRTAAQKALQHNPKTFSGRLKVAYEVVSSPAVTEMARQLYYAGRVGNNIERATDGGFDGTYTTMMLAPVVSAFMMIIGDSFYNDFYKQGIMGRDNRGKGKDGSKDAEARRESVAFGISRMADGYSSRIGIYPKIVAMPLLKAAQTGFTSDKGDEEGIGFTKIFLQSLLKKTIFDSLSRYATTSVQGIQTVTNDDGTPLDNMLEYILNMNSKSRQDVQNLTQAAYFNMDNVGDNGEIKSVSDVQSKVVNLIPFLRDIKATPDLGVVEKILTDFANDSGTNELFVRGATRDKIEKGLDNIAGAQMLGTTEAKEYLEKNPNATMEELIAKGKVTDSYPPFKFMMDALRGKKNMGGDMQAVIAAGVSDEDAKKIDMMVKEMIDKYDKDGSSWNGTDVKERFDELLANVTRTGSLASAAYISNAMSNGYKKHLRKAMGLKSKDINEGKAGVSGESDFYGTIASENNTSSPQYQEYIKKAMAFDKELLVSNRKYFAGERHAISDMQKDYFMKVKDFPLKGIQSQVGNMSSTLGQVMTLKAVDKAMQDQGYGNGVFNSYSNIFAKEVARIKSEKDPEKRGAAIRGLMSQGSEMMHNIHKTSTDPQQIALHRIGYATAVAPLIKEIQSSDPETAKKLISVVGQAAFNSYVDSITDTNPATVAAAFELLSGDSAHGGKGGGGGGGGIPKGPKASPLKIKKLVENYNNLNIVAAKVRGLDSPSLPKFTYEYDSQQRRYIPVKIDIKPTLSDIKSEQLRPKQQPAGQLRVGSAPVKSGRVISGSARPKSISGSKAYTRRFGEKRV